MLRHQELAEQSIRRKIAHLEELAASYLETLIIHSEVIRSQKSEGSVQQAEALLAEANDRIATVVECTTKPVEAGLSEVISEIINQTTKEASAAKNTGHPLSKALVTATLLAMAETAATARRQLEELARSLGEILQNISKACGFPNNPTLNEVVAGFTPLPHVDETRLDDIFEVRLPQIFFWKPVLTLGIIRRRIKRQGYRPIWYALSDHRRKVQVWLKDNLDRACQAYESYAALSRDQLRHAGNERAGFETAEQVQADLALLRGLRTTPQENIP